MFTFFSLILSPRAQALLSQPYRRFRQHHRLGFVMASFLTLLWVGAHMIFRLEGRHWRSLLQQYRPWFAHLYQRPYRFGDLLRYVLQVLSLVLLRLPGVNRLSLRSGRVVQAGLAFCQAVFTWFGRLVDAAAQYLHQYFSKTRFVGQALTSNKDISVVPKRWVSWESLLWLLGFITLFSLTGLLISQPFNLVAQVIFVVLLWSAAMLIRKVPGHFSNLLLIVLSLVVSTRYIWWRYTATLNWDNKLDIFFGLLLLSAETYSWLVLVLGYIQTAWPLERPVASLPKDTSLWPTVDLMIPTYNEDLSVVKPTVYAALGMDWPKDKLRIYLLDDGRRPAFKEFAEQAGVEYIIRPDGRHAKAGNLNHAMGKTDGDLIAVFDCDHIPSRSFLQLTVGWFLRDKNLALVQTPHHFFSPDPFERNLGTFGKQPNENTLFYGLIQDGNDLWNGAFFCGSCAVLRREALNSIGGFAVETVTEDAHTALRLHRQGFNSAYLRIPMAAGLATESLSAHVGQRIRWARGMAQIFRTDNPIFGRGLSFFQRICYTNAMLHFLMGIPRLIYLTAPLAFLIFHSYIIYAPVILILLYVLPHMVHASLTNSRMQGSYRRTFWGEVYETVLAWYIAVPTTVALFSPHKGSFNVTAKGGLVDKSYFDWKIALPYVVLTFLNLLGLALGIWRLWTGPVAEVLTVVVTMIWVLYNLVILGAAVAVAAESQQVRQSHRVAAAAPASVKTKAGLVFSAVLMDFSNDGVGLQLNTEALFQQGEKVTVILSRGDRQFAFEGEVVRSDKKQLGVYFSSFAQEQQVNFVQCTFARADAWLSAGQNFSLDQPVSSFVDVLLTCFQGFRRLVIYLPFPLNVLLNLILQSVQWIASFVPRRYPVQPYEK